MTQQREARLVNEYLMKYWPNTIQWKRVRVGPSRNQEEAKMYQVLQRWADAILWNGEEIIIIEAKIRPTAGAVGQLEHYIELFPQTPEFKRYWNKPIKGVLLVAMPDVELASYATSKGLEYTVYQPDWAIDYLKSREK